MKKFAMCLLAGCLLLGLTACSQDGTHVFVQKVVDLSQMDGISATDRFAGLVVSESVTEIKRDSDKVIAEVYVQEGDDVKEGQELFTYDTEQLQLTLDKQRLEAEQLEASIENYTNQIAQLETDRDKAWSSSDKLKYTLQIQTNQIDLKEAEINLKTKQSEITKSETLLDNAVVASPVDGRVTFLGDDENSSSESSAYITIQQTGTYRIKGTLNEMQFGTISEGTRMRVESRLDSSVYWLGTVTLVDYENPTQSSGSYYTDADEMANSSRYPFYVELDSSDGMLLGQHMYLTVEQTEETALSGVTLSGAFLCWDEDGSAYVWADNSGKLEKRTVELGQYSETADAYEILSGLSETDYVAYPDDTVCVEGAPTTRTEQGGSENS